VQVSASTLRLICLLTRSYREQDGDVMYQMGYYNYTTDGSVTDVLFFHFSGDKIHFASGMGCRTLPCIDNVLNTLIGSQAMILNNAVYSAVRAKVEQKLGDNATKYVENIDIS
jgi:hypothetical protein